METGLYTHLPVLYRQGKSTHGYKLNGYTQHHIQGQHQLGGEHQLGGWDGGSSDLGGDSVGECDTTHRGHTTQPYSVDLCTENGLLQTNRPSQQSLSVDNRLLEPNGVPRDTCSASPRDCPEGGTETGDVVSGSHHRRHRRQPRGRHHHRMRLHDSNVRRLLAVHMGSTGHVGGAVHVKGTEDGEVPCTCEGTEIAERLGHWGSTAHTPVPNPSRPPPRPKKAPQNKRPRHPYRGGSAGMYHVPPEDDNFRFHHYEDTGLYMRQYRQEHTICIQGADPTRPPVLGRDTPDPYLAKLQQCGDLVERLMALTALARQHTEQHAQHQQGENGCLQGCSLTKAMQSEHAAPRDFLSPDLSGWIQCRSQAPRKAVNLAPIRDCRLSVKNIQFPQKQQPKRQAAHMAQLQQQQQPQQQQPQTAYHQPLPSELQTPRVAFPLPVRIVVNSESLKGNKLTTLSPPHTPTTRRRRLSRSESTEHQLARPPYPINYSTDSRFAKKKSEGDIRCPHLSTASASDLSIYDQYLSHNKVKEDTTGHLLFAPVTKGTHSGGNRKKKETKTPSLGLCELYSSTSSGTLITAVNNR